MIWIRLAVNCILSVALAGLAANIFVLVLSRLHKSLNLYLMLTLQKAALLLYWLPIPFLAVCTSRIEYAAGNIVYVGDFVCSTFPLMTRLFLLLGIVWSAGAIISVLRGVRKKIMLDKIMRGNVSVEDDCILRLFDEYCKWFGIGNVELLRNDLIKSPITHGGRRKRIILPFLDYSEKQLHIIFEHEFNHIARHDLFWRKLAFVTTWVHWFNPFVYKELRDIIYMEELICDDLSSKGKTWFSQREYAGFLAEFTDNKMAYISTLALGEEKSEILKRIEALASHRDVKGISKAKAISSGLTLAAAALIFAGGITAKAAKAQEEWILSEELVTQAPGMTKDFADKSIESHYAADDGVTEVTNVILTQEAMPASSLNLIIIDKKINATERVLYEYQNLSEGSRVNIVVECGDKNAQYKVGIKNRETNEIISVDAKGMLVHTFEILSDGVYSAFIENCSNRQIKVYGTVNIFQDINEIYINLEDVQFEGDKGERYTTYLARQVEADVLSMDGISACHIEFEYNDSEILAADVRLLCATQLPVEKEELIKKFISKGVGILEENITVTYN